MVWTVAFAVLGVGLGATCGFVLAIACTGFAPVRVLATVLRSVHELFWALLLIQVFGLGADDRPARHRAAVYRLSSPRSLPR